MKKIVLLMLVCILAGGYVHAQNVFPATGRTGIYTTTPAASLQVKGGARMGTLTNYINIDSATGNLSFLGSANYLVQNNQFAFRAATASNIGLYFNQTNSRIEFRNSGGTSVFNVGVGPSGNNVGIGTSTPAAKLDVNGDALINGVWVGRGNNSVVGNVALGSSLTLTVGDANTAIGTDALDGTTTGVNNTAVGYQSLLLNSTGSQNTGLGLYTLYPNTTGNNNTAIGVRAMDNNATGSGNTAVGISSLTTNTSGNNNTALGYLANVTQGDLTNATAIGANAKVSTSNSLVLGDNANVGIGTSAPAAKLDVAGNIKIADGTQGAGKVLTSDANGLASWTAPAVSPWTVSGNDISNSNSGNVGIGTSAPTAKLDVSGAANISGGLFSSKIAVASSLNDLINNAPWYGIGYSNLTLPGQTNPATQVGGYWGINFVDRGGNMVFSRGNLGIGTSGPAAKLDVNGDALINGIKVGKGGGNISGNTVMGNQALQYNTTGGTNTAFGRYALLYNSTGYSNVAIGENALRNNTTTSNLVAVGDSALYNNGYGATASYQAIANTAIGSKTLFANTFGSYNTAVGFQALYSNDISGSNVAVGYQALKSIAGPVQGGANTAVGTIALTSLTTGYYNTAVGDWALHRTTTGSNNTGMGEDCMAYNVAGSYNTAMGLYALSGGDNNYCTALGANAGSNAVVSITNSTAIGNGATVDVSNKVRIGNTSVTSIGGQVGWTTFSDGRYKKNIKEDVKGLAFINSLKPVTYTVDVNGLNTYLYKNRGHDKKHDTTYDKMKKDLQPTVDEASKIVYNGFIAQDVEAAAEKLNYNFSGVDKPKTKDGLYGLRYADFVVPLVKAVQELSTANGAKDQTIQSLQATVDKQQQQINAILQKLNDLQTAQQACCNNAGSVQSSGSQAITLNGSDIASLQQNVPNPYNNTTVINFSLPKQYKSAQIVITDISGQTIQQANVTGTNSLKIAAGSLASGNYKYSLFVDGKLISTKTMVIAK